MTILNRRNFLVSLLAADVRLGILAAEAQLDILAAEAQLGTLVRQPRPQTAHAFLSELWQTFVKLEGTTPTRIGVSPTMFQQFRDEISGWSAPVRMQDIPDVGNSVPSSRLLFKGAVVSIGPGLVGKDYTIGA